MVLKGVKLVNMDANPFQVRIVRDEEEELRLLNSIRESGMLVPPLVRPHPTELDRYIIVDGQRRVDQARSLGWLEVVVDVRELTEEQAAKATMTTNIERESLNPIERAMGYRLQMEKFGRTQQEVADSNGVSRSQVANLLRLLDMDYFIKTAVMCETLSPWQALAIGALPEGFCQWRLASIAMDWGLSVQELRASVKDMVEGGPFITWWRMVPVAGLFGEDDLFDLGAIFEGPLICYADGSVESGHDIVRRAKAEKLDSLEAMVIFPTDFLRDPIPQLAGYEMVSEDDSSVDFDASHKIIPQMSPEQKGRMDKHIRMLSGMMDRYPVLIVHYHKGHMLHGNPFLPLEEVLRRSRASAFPEHNTFDV